jgi:hypothetical protein
MNPASINTWKKLLSITFITGGILLGLTDLFHTATGTQIYLFHSNVLMIERFRWPWYLPAQMGMIAVIMVASWTVIFTRLIHPAIGLLDGEDTQPLGALLPPFAIVMIIAGFVLGYCTLGYEHHLSLYIALYVLSLMFISLSFSRYYLIAFLFIGASGPMAEWFLLSPSVGYYEFVQKDLFGRVPGWQLFAYGWGGVFFHWLSAGMRTRGIAAR